MSGRYNFTLRQGDDYDETFTFEGTLLTGYTALMQIRDRVSGAVKVTCDSSASTMMIAVGATDSVITPIITAVQTAALSPGVYDYDLQLTSPVPTSKVKTELEGTVMVEADVTRLP